MPHILIVELVSDDFSELGTLYQMASDIKGATINRLELKAYDEHSPSSPPPSKKRSYDRVSSRFRDGHSDKGIKSRDLIREILRRDGPTMNVSDLRKKFNSWPFPGRTGCKFAPSTFSAELGQMVRSGEVIRTGDVVRLKSG
jgi:uncharacterized protein YodC (DUF2158 family)